jgi:hypothetical protein
MILFGGTPVNEEGSSQIITLRKYLIGATIDRQEGYGRCADTEKLKGANTNRILFQITASDEQGLFSELNAQSDESEREP